MHDEVETIEACHAEEPEVAGLAIFAQGHSVAEKDHGKEVNKQAFEKGLYDPDGEHIVVEEEVALARVVQLWNELAPVSLIICLQVRELGGIIVLFLVLGYTSFW